MIDTGTAIGLAGALLGAASLARTRWLTDNRQDRADHQDCLDRLAAHITATEERFDAMRRERDGEVSQLRSEHAACQSNLLAQGLVIASQAQAITQLQARVDAIVADAERTAQSTPTTRDAT